ncbi:MAG: methylenetetrahydrofolate reductase [Candidatus Altiarchaeota archaeon]|nr:methylenetetrahydrofolate reductase [Candidatus Altiarchaeota archaeon]
MSKLSEKFGRQFVITGEITPPRGPDLTVLDRDIGIFSSIKNKLDAINVVDNPGSMLLMSSLACSIILKQHGLEPVYQLTCRDRNIFALESDLIAAAAFGIENVLALTGDHPACHSSEHPKAAGVFELDSASLLALISNMNRGLDGSGQKINAPTRFYAGAAAAPGAKPIEPEIHKMQRKLSAGARFFQTQAIFEIDVMENFLAKTEQLIGDQRSRMIMSIVPLYSYKMYEFLIKIPGVIITEKTALKIKNAKDPVEEAVSLASEMVDKAKELGLVGVHIMPAGKMRAFTRLIERL